MRRIETYKGYHLEYLSAYKGQILVSIYKFDKSKTFGPKSYSPQYNLLQSYDCTSMNEASQKAHRFINKREGYTYKRTERYLK
jgi:hypothetical protein